MPQSKSKLSLSLSLNRYGRQQLDPGQTYRGKASPAWQLVYVPVGLGQFRLGKGGEVLRVRRKNCFLIPPRSAYQLTAQGSAELEWVWVEFNSPMKAKSLPHGLIRLGKLPNIEVLHAFLDGLDTNTHCVREAELLAWVAQVLAFLGTERSDISARHYALADRAKQYAQDNLDRVVTLQELAEVFNMTSAHAGQMFQKAVGVAFKPYHEGLRLERAKWLLEQRGMIVKDVATLLGFSSAAYLSRRYKAKFGTPPSAPNTKNP